MNMMDKMARAIEAAETEWENNCPTPFDGPMREVEDYPDRSMTLAKAALTTLLEPDEGMVAPSLLPLMVHPDYPEGTGCVCDKPSSPSPQPFNTL
jgi:hypothetical protein